ncbi:cyclin-dependent kinase inhibitor 3 [Labeo rohita]|uniref:protein-tyrosine-phosphatase n=1 Tax=Labeo rohita TaxID=84645 RepID=A0A498LQT2_LABRO|nr:cyclin-dependent kinase inhibitor 3 [Labeo rohita]RXN10530.1 cyclin-dependent kinase inhibitor 3 [Labeo rohita]
MRTSEFDSSDEEDIGEVEATPFQISCCYGGLGRSGLIAACLLLQLSVSMTPSSALEILRELRGGGAIQTVKQYNFLHEFREKFEAYQETKERLSERSVSR